MDDLMAQSLKKIADIFEEDIEFYRNNSSPKKRYTQLFKGYVIQHVLDFNEYSKVARISGIKRDTIKKWVKRARRNKRYKAHQQFVQLKVICHAPHMYEHLRRGDK